jgi:hypothetical protein
MKAFIRQVFASGLVAVNGVSLSAAVEQPVVGSRATNGLEAAVIAAEVQAVPGPVTPKLAYGVADIVKLAQAKVSDAVILDYIENSGTVYSLDPGQIVYLRDAGVSEPVVSAMLNQRKKYAELGARTTPPGMTVATPPAQPASSSVACVVSPAGGAELAPADQPVSSVYVIPYPASSYDYGCPWPAYYSIPFYGGCFRFRYGFDCRRAPLFYSAGRFGQSRGLSARPTPRHGGFRR